MTQNGYSEKQVLTWAKLAYEKWDAEFKIRTESCALLVIDMQDEFVMPGWTPYWVPEATRQVPIINKLISHCRKKNIPVIFTVYSKTNDYLDRPKSGKSMPNRLRALDIDQSSYFTLGKVWREVDFQPGDFLIHKPSYGAFYDTPLESILKNLNKDTVIICGTLSNYCCGSTARQAYERSFKVVFGSDVNSSEFPELQENELKVLRKGFARVMSCDEIIGVLG